MSLRIRIMKNWKEARLLSGRNKMCVEKLFSFSEPKFLHGFGKDISPYNAVPFCLLLSIILFLTQTDVLIA